ncbi:unnamed protein product [marine sediment metagenome]|uniref:Nucleotide-diphospho-sugar transferase domain-containing protein n=1 Tax=marine sediment metagenome TaxID=412755 RepID=X1EF28_9ZZZZ
MELIRYAMEEDGYDQIVYLDWDCIPVKQIPNNFWDILSQKKPFQACLQMYRKTRAPWRGKTDRRKIPNGGFMYIADKEIPKEGIRLWEEIGEGYNDEPAWGKLTDNMTDGWKGIGKYFELFEPEFCNLHKNSGYGSRPDLLEKLENKDVCFVHHQGL